MNTEQHRYRIHGLLVRSDVELDGDRAAGLSADVQVHLEADEFIGAEPGDGFVVAEFVTPDRRWWTATEAGPGYLLRFHGNCDVYIDQGLTSLTCRPQPGSEPDVVPLLVSGTGLSFLLGLRGSLVLHASAVQIGGRSVALVGLPGMGKSTLAGLLCSVGGRLVTDDALRVEMTGVAHCFRGTSKVRLREGASSILDLFPHVTPGTSPDERMTLALTPSEPQCFLSAVLIPRLSLGDTGVETQRIDPAEAVFRLSPFLRVAGWRRPDLVSRHFLLLGQLVQQTPAFVLTVPWLTPFTPEFASELFTSVESLIESSSPPG